MDDMLAKRDAASQQEAKETKKAEATFERKSRPMDDEFMQQFLTTIQKAQLSPENQRRLKEHTDAQESATNALKRVL